MKKKIQFIQLLSHQNITDMKNHHNICVLEAFLNGLLEALNASGCTDVQIKALNPLRTIFFLVPWELFSLSLCTVMQTPPYMLWHKRLPVPEAAHQDTVAALVLPVSQTTSLSSPPAHLQGFLGLSLCTLTQSNGQMNWQGL